MCGIAGIIQFKPSFPLQPVVERMTTAMAHRGPNSAGIYSDETVSLGHRRLSIIDLSTAANQPFSDPSDRFVLVFNGEIYNYQEIKILLPDYPFKTSSDTEVLLAAYIKWGADCVHHFKGMFAFAIWDKQERSLFLARDRMGVKPLYFYTHDEFLLFASESRAILASDLIPRQIDHQALVEYFSYQSIGFPKSMIKGVQQMEAGSWMMIKDNQVEKKIYWVITDADKYAHYDFSNRPGVQKKIRDLLRNAVAGRMVSDVPVGAFLSGGIDSSAIVGLMAEVSDRPVNTFNISFDESEFNEAPYADMVARKFNTNHTNIRLTPKALLVELENALNALDSPSGDGINTYVVSKAIHNAGITVALSGIGGDELFAGYPIFSQYQKMQRRKRLFQDTQWLRTIAGKLMTKGNQTTRNDRMRQILTAPGASIEYMYPVFREILSPEIISSITKLQLNSIFDTLLAQDLRSRKDQLAALPLLSQVSAAEYLGYTQHTLLKDTDQMSMAVSLEVREPFFDYSLIEFVMAVPDDLKNPAGYPKSLLVDSLHPLLPDDIVLRKKQGFTFPWESWMKNELRAFCSYHIRGLAGREFIKSRALMEYWNRFLLDDPTIRWAEIWLFVVLGYWLERNNIDA